MAGEGSKDRYRPGAYRHHAEEKRTQRIEQQPGRPADDEAENSEANIYSRGLIRQSLHCANCEAADQCSAYYSDDQAAS